MCAAADRGFTWSDEETAALLRFWAAHDAQSAAAAGNKRNFVIYETISEKMNAMGFNRSTSQCREKIKRMKREYTLTKQYNGTTNGPKKLMRFYDQFEAILLEKQKKNQKNNSLKARALVSAVADVTPPQDPESWIPRPGKRSFKYRNPSGKSGNHFQDKSETDPWAPDIVLIEGDAPSSSMQNSSQSPSPTSPWTGDTLPKKKRKKIASRMSMFQSMMDAMMTKFIDYHEQTDSKFLTQMELLEHQRQEADENIQKMWMRFEERRRKEERDHELRILATFKEILSQIKENTASKT